MIRNPLMIPIPAGSITMRDDRKKSAWTVEIRPFLLASHPVTQELYACIMQDSEDPQKEEAHHAFLGPNLPVECVSWLDAIRFCNRLSNVQGFREVYDFQEEENPDFSENACEPSKEGCEPPKNAGKRDRSPSHAVICNREANGYRLPSEAEWEYACRAGTSGVRYGELSEIAWYEGNSSGTTHPVGLKQPNPWGLYDMLGNVWEWCWDVYDPAVYGDYRVFRGGGWSDPERGCLASNRRRSHPTFRIEDLGFRVARSAHPPQEAAAPEKGLEQTHQYHNVV